MEKRNFNISENKVSALPDTDTLNEYLNNSGIDSSLAELVKIRTSQLNECEYCTNLHIQQAQLSGEKDRKIIGLNIWSDIPFYSDKERAALAWTEVLTRFPEKKYQK